MTGELAPSGDAPPRDPEAVARQVDASLRAREEAELVSLHSQLGAEWYEFFLLCGLFAFGIGVAATIFFAVPMENELIYRFMVFWLMGLLIMGLLTLEYLIRRIRVMRRLLVIMLRRHRRAR